MDSGLWSCRSARRGPYPPSTDCTLEGGECALESLTPRGMEPVMPEQTPWTSRLPACRPRGGVVLTVRSTDSHRADVT